MVITALMATPNDKARQHRTCDELCAEAALEAVKQCKRDAKHAAKLARTPVATPETKRALAEMAAEDKAAKAVAPAMRRNTTGNVWGKSLKPNTPAERAASAVKRAAVQKKYQATPSGQIATASYRQTHPKSIKALNKQASRKHHKLSQAAKLKLARQTWEQAHPGVRLVHWTARCKDNVSAYKL